MMEQDLKPADGVEVKASESLAAEQVEVDISLKKDVGPLALELQGVAKISIDNAKLVALAASRVPGGFLHSAIQGLAGALGVVLPAVEAAPAAAPAPEAAPAAPSA